MQRTILIWDSSRSGDAMVLTQKLKKNVQHTIIVQSYSLPIRESENSFKNESLQSVSHFYTINMVWHKYEN